MLSRRAVCGGLCGGLALTGCDRPEATGSGLAETVRAETGAMALAGIVVGRDGVRWREAAGRRHARGAPVTADDVWHIGSNTKAMTAAVYGVLVQQGRARWGARLADLLPGVATGRAGEASVEALLGHRAGLADRGVIGLRWLQEAGRSTESLPAQRLALARSAFARESRSDPPFAYANVNYVVAGAVMERITGATWEDAIRDLLWRPLGMMSAGFGAPTGKQPWGHRRLGPWAWGQDPAAGRADNPPALGPAGTAHMTLADHARFARAMLGGGAVLGDDTVAHLTQPVGGGEPPYALGWGVAPDGRLGHDGSNTFWYERIVLDRAAGLAVITASNDAARGARACATLADRLVKDWT